MIGVFLAALVLCAWYALPHALKLRQIAALRRRCSAGRIIVLTYDDGPGERVTPELLGTLRSFGATATFFMLGWKTAASPDRAAKVVGEGHELGSHSHRHLHAWKRDPVSIFLDIRRGLHSTRALAECRLFRAPYGKLTFGSLVQVWLERCRQSWWTIDSTDTWATPKPVAAVLDEIRQGGGGVILLHDHDRPEHREREAYVVDLTRSILGMARSEGFQVKKLSELYDLQYPP